MEEETQQKDNEAQIREINGPRGPRMPPAEPLDDTTSSSDERSGSLKAEAPRTRKGPQEGVEGRAFSSGYNHKQGRNTRAMETQVENERAKVENKCVPSVN